MFEYVKFNCHVMARNDIGKKTPTELFNEYLSSRVDGVDYIFDNIKCTVASVSWAVGKASIITKILKTEDVNNDIICTK